MLSVFICLITLLVFLIPVFLIIRSQKGNRQLKLTLYVFLLIMVFRLFVGIRGADYLSDEVRAGTDQNRGTSVSDGAPENLNVVESFFDSVVHTLQTFSMDEDYTLYTKAGKRLFLENGYPLTASAYGFIISILNLCAPILGGALLLELLVGIFPYIKIIINPYRRKFVFSELNDESITLAEDLVRDNNYKKFHGRKEYKRKPMIIFTDAYPDLSSEPKMELFERAKAISAICVRTDLLHINLRSSKSLSYFLMDRSAEENISTFSQLLIRDRKGKWLWPVSFDADDPVVRFYIFTKSEIEDVMIWRAFNRFEAGKRKREAEDDKKRDSTGDVEKAVDNTTSAPGDDVQKIPNMIVRPIRDYMNSSIRLMFDVPLFLPFIGNTEAVENPEEGPAVSETAPARITDLYLAILGAGNYAEEAFKAAFWCGQIVGIQLHIDVVAKDALDLRRRLSDSCPELLESCLELPGSCRDKEGRRAAGEQCGDAAAASNSFRRSKILVIDPMDPEQKQNPPYAVIRFHDLEDPCCWSDYPDGLLDRTDYFIVALGEDLRDMHVTEKIRTQLIRQAESGCRRHTVISPVVFDDKMADLIRRQEPGEGEPYVLPFGQLTDRFSCRNVLMDTFIESAEKDAALYSRDKQNKMKKDEYSHWANLAKAVHYPYKLFGLGIIEGMNLNKTGRDRYMISSPRKVSAAEDEELAWCEHRRWNAFLRTQGFCCPTKAQFDRYYRQHCERGDSEVFKDIPLKFHPCLVERGLERKTLPPDLLEMDPAPAGFDSLSRVSAEHGTDYMQYDYKEEDDDLKKYLF